MTTRDVALVLAVIAMAEGRLKAARTTAQPLRN